jgi:hypothetical protein
MSTLDQVLLKYCPAVGGYGILGIPIFTSRGLKYKTNNDQNDTGAITKDFIKNTGLLLNVGKV